MIRLHTLRRHACILLLAGVTACAAPGTPVMRSSEADGGGPLLDGCQNVADVPPERGYVTTFYQSTWSSAFLEGGNQGVREGLAEGGGLAGITPSANPRRTSGESVRFNDLPFQPEPFCRKFQAEMIRVADAVADIIKELGNPIIRSDKAAGYFETDFI